MKKFLLALVATAAFAGSASAADLAARPYTKAPAPMAPLDNWTGFYIFGGAGGGIWDASTNTRVTGTGVPRSINQTQGGDGWFVTVVAGCDWEVNHGWVG